MPATPDKIPAKVPVPVALPNPVRASILGVTDKIADLKAFVAVQELDPDLKTYLQTELDELDSNAATIDLHCVEQTAGGFDLHLSIRPFQLGAGKPV